MSECEHSLFAERVASKLRDPEPVEPAFEARLRSAARAAVARGEAPWQQQAGSAGDRARRRWFTTPRAVHVSPLAALAAAAVFAAVVAGSTLALSGGGRGGSAREVAAVPPARHEVVRFVIEAPTARRVSLVGDFNGWDPGATPLARGEAGGAWVVTVPLTPGRYQYAFVVDGQTWLADPAVPLALEDEFGTPSSLVMVGGGRT